MCPGGRVSIQVSNHSTHQCYSLASSDTLGDSCIDCPPSSANDVTHRTRRFPPLSFTIVSEKRIVYRRITDRLQILVAVIVLIKYVVHLSACSGSSLPSLLARRPKTGPSPARHQPSNAVAAGPFDGRMSTVNWRQSASCRSLNSLLSLINVA